MKIHASLTYRLAVLFLSLFAVTAVCSNAAASGFALIEQGVSGLGNAYAGAAATAEDASTIFFNPAGLTRVKGMQGIVAGHLIIPSAKFTNNGSTLVGGTVSLTGNVDNGGAVAFVPNTYASYQANDRVFLGIGINAPFGLKTEFDNNWVGRYHGTLTDMMTVNVNPTVAVKFNNYVSFGAGLNIQYIRVKYGSRIDFGLIMNPALAQQRDGAVMNEGDSLGFGFNLGALIEPTDKTRFGIAYRSRVKHDLKGDADFSDVPAALAGMFYDTPITADVTLPDTLSFSAYHEFLPQWAVMADATWTNWSLFKEVRIKYANGLPDGLTTTIWKDSWRYSLGLTYAPSPSLKLRAGVAYDLSPVRNPEHRTPRIPCEDRFWTALGFTYVASKGVTLDAGYVHIFVKDPKVNLQATPTNENRLRGNLVGSFDASVNIISAQARIAF